MLRVPMTGQLGISSRVTEWSDALRARAAANAAVYKRIRTTVAGDGDRARATAVV